MPLPLRPTRTFMDKLASDFQCKGENISLKFLRQSQSLQEYGITSFEETGCRVEWVWYPKSPQKLNQRTLMNDVELLTKHFTLLSSADVVDFVNTLLKELQLLVWGEGGGLCVCLKSTLCPFFHSLLLSFKKQVFVYPKFKPMPTLGCKLVVFVIMALKPA